VIAAINAAIQLKSKYNIRVINLSLVVQCLKVSSWISLPAVEAAYRAGIVVVVAAGNDGRDNSLEQTDMRRSRRPETIRTSLPWEP